jgi:hypothetical protein
MCDFDDYGAINVLMLLCLTIIATPQHATNEGFTVVGIGLILMEIYEKEKKMSQQGASCCYSDEDFDDNGTNVSRLDEVFMSLDDDLDQTSLPN